MNSDADTMSGNPEQPEVNDVHTSSGDLGSELEAIVARRDEALQYLKNNGLDPAPNFQERLALQDEFVTAALSNPGGERYNWTSGDYRDIEYATSAEPTSEPGQMMSGEAVKHEELIKNLVDSSLVASSGEPVIVLDIGGGVGISWARLAQQYEDDITQGRVVFAVSNLAGTPDSFLEPNQMSQEPRLRRRHMGSDPVASSAPIPPVAPPRFPKQSELNAALLSEVQERGLVQYIRSTFSDLPDSEVTLANGQSVALRGHVALAHESRSLTMGSKVPELDILKAAEERAQRTEAIRRAHQALQSSRGMQPEYYSWPGADFAQWSAFRSS